MDKVGDLLTRIKNGYLASKKEVYAPFSKLSLAIANLLTKEGFIENCVLEEKQIKIILKYTGGAGVKLTSGLVGVKRISKPGRRVYKNKKSLPFVLSGLGLAIISTPKGIMSDRQARKEGIGGEIMAYVW